VRRLRRTQDVIVGVGVPLHLDQASGASGLAELQEAAVAEAFLAEVGLALAQLGLQAGQVHRSARAETRHGLAEQRERSILFLRLSGEAHLWIAVGARQAKLDDATPFQVGEEVLVSIEEPHMYNVDDAVARVDSYIVSVTGAGRLVGDRRLVRIESVGRAAATASLVGGAEEDNGNGADDAEGGSPNGDPVESSSSRRRRGRRGGRRRSRAQAQNPSNGD